METLDPQAQRAADDDRVYETRYQAMLTRSLGFWLWGAVALLVILFASMFGFMLMFAVAILWFAVPIRLLLWRKRIAALPARHPGTGSCRTVNAQAFTLWALTAIPILLAGIGVVVGGERRHDPQYVVPSDSSVTSITRTLAADERRLGPEHLKVVWDMERLALLDAAQGRFAKAESLYDRALAIREKVQGPEHPDVVGTLEHLADLYRVEGRAAAADSVAARIAAIREHIRNPGRPDVPQSVKSPGGR